MPKVSVIAIDGPAGSGKSALAERLAKQLGYVFFDTGVVYRTVTWVGLQRGTDLADEEAMTSLAKAIKISVLRPTKDDGRQYTVMADDEDVTWQIFLPEVDRNVSAVSAYPEVRRALLAQQQAIARQGQVVMVGRDIGTVVAPDADLKIYLDASAEVRAQRRLLQSQSRGIEASYEKILADLKRRDKVDSEREAAPLKMADDATPINTDNVTIDQEVDLVRGMIRQREG
ncbi:MAG: (d)CMP kinase [Dehalococcoidales bacterium]|nr:(d)CMP kinase [Dehalococcoidales bacterium]